MNYSTPANLGLFSNEAENIVNTFLEFLKNKGYFITGTGCNTINNYISTVSPRVWKVGYTCGLKRATNNELQFCFMNASDYYGPVKYSYGSRTIYNGNTALCSRTQTEAVKWLGFKMMCFTHDYFKLLAYNAGVHETKKRNDFAKKHWRLDNNDVCEFLECYNKGKDRFGEITVKQVYMLSIFLMDKKNLIKRIKKNAASKKLFNGLIGEEFDPFITAQEENRRSEIARIKKELEDIKTKLASECSKMKNAAIAEIESKYRNMRIEAEEAAKKQIKELNDTMEALKTGSFLAA